jgi:hypothetical protein
MGIYVKKMGVRGKVDQVQKLVGLSQTYIIGGRSVGWGVWCQRWRMT